MLKARGVINGRPTYFIGLSFGNLDRFRAEPGDTYVRIPKEESGLPDDIILFSGETEADLATTLPVDPNTKVVVSDRLKQ